MKLTKEELKFKNRTTWSYIGFTFQTFFKRPFGYIIALLYVLYLAIILLIVPAGVHLQPLFIWSNAAINMPIFNLFFIAAASGALAVAVFRTGRDDGTELTLCAKPITKNTRVFGKTFTYLIIMLMFTAITIAILALIWPVFGEYNILTNPTGIEWDKYTGLLLSIFVGNTVNMLFFGGISVLISMVGGQVITIIGSVGIAFLMVLMNIIFPLTVASPRSIINDKYNTSISSMAANTRSEFNKTGNSKLKNYCAIQCITEEDGTEVAHFDTHEYWTKANKESGMYATNYIDLGKQLSYTYSSFGLDSVKLDSAKKLMIGANNTNYYTTLANTHVSSAENLAAQNYPIAMYDIASKQGVSYPVVRLLAGDLDVTGNNWYANSTILKTDFDAVIIASSRSNGYSLPKSIKDVLSKTWFKMSDLILTDAELAQSKIMFEKILECNPVDYSESSNVDDSAWIIIQKLNKDVFWKGNFGDLTKQEKLTIISKIQLSWSIFAQDKQIYWVNNYCKAKGINDSFPFKSITIKNWFEDEVVSQKGEKKKYYFPLHQLKNVFLRGIFVDTVDDLDPFYSMMQAKSLEYCETYNNLYQYDVVSFYNINLLVTIWTLVSIGLFTGSIIVYKKTDFK